MPAITALHDSVAAITFSHPSVNGLGLEIRRGLIDALKQVVNNDAVKAIVVTSGKHYFPGGADIEGGQGAASLFEMLPA